MNITVTRVHQSFGMTSLLFVAAMGLSGAYSVVFWHSPLRWLGLGAVVLSAGGLSYSLWKKQLLLQIDDNGIFDATLGVGKIAWEDVDDAQLQTTEENCFLCLRIRNPEPYVQRLWGTQRKKVLFHRGLGFNGFNVNVSRADVDLLELKKQIDRRLRRSAQP